jgi:acyl carrier protein phosphodiesterase
VNFLAHCALGARSDELLVGGFLGDFVKGPVPTDLPATIQEGIRLHRRLDAYSATEPHIRASVARLPTQLRRFAPPFVDLLADHLLALDFVAQHGESLCAFSARAYRAIESRRELLPAAAERFFDAMQEADLFDRYRDFASVERAFARLMARVGREDAIAPMVAQARTRYDELGRDFASYYPNLRAHADAWLESRAKRGTRAELP